MTRVQSVALLISTYNRPDALHLALDSILTQTVLPNEILIGDDGSDDATAELVEAFRFKSPVPVKHFWHPKDGFQKTKILNKAVAGTLCDYIIQIDGDIILHPSFVADHLGAAEQGCFIRGSRVMLLEALTDQFIREETFRPVHFYSRGIINRINAMRIPLLIPFFTRHWKRSDNVQGFNFAYWREDFVRVNGYDNSIKGWGHEDIELAARMINAGLVQKKIKMRALCYHLCHPFSDRAQAQSNYSRYKESVKLKRHRCLNGLEQQQAY